MSESVLVAGARTPLSRPLAALGPPSPAELGAVAIREALGRTGIDGAGVGRVVVGHGPTAGAGRGLSRRAALRAGVAPGAAPPPADDVGCALGLGAIALADELVRTGKHHVVVAAGLECMPSPPRGAAAPGGTEPYNEMFPRDLVEFSDKDAYAAALASHPGFGYGAGGRGLAGAGSAAVTAGQDAGHVPEHALLAAEAHALRSVSGPRTPIASFARSRHPALHAPTGTGTGPVPNGAAALIVMRKSLAMSLGIGWLAEISAYATAPPADGESGAPLVPSPVRALEKALATARVAAVDLEHTEVDPTLPAWARASLHRLGAGPRPDGSPARGDTPGLPLGASGPRVALHLAQALNRRAGGLGGVVMCAPEGHSEALLIRAASGGRRVP
ncbi:hypothetical protein ACFFKE_11030 [Streptomyces mutabilis]|uniref:thiolase family protein n=1 Tax=Streptomyces mutabilis TaxID=67332 RepID=UPI00177F7958|nr:hypothetical protein [Streptomyces mutabilis]GGQ49079.1 putative acetyl-CoA acetyltransferase [Streptomyces mutabilis]